MVHVGPLQGEVVLMNRDVEVDALWDANDMRVREISELYRKVYVLWLTIGFLSLGITLTAVGSLLHILDH